MNPQRRFSHSNHRKPFSFKLASLASSLLLCVLAVAPSTANSSAQDREYKVKTFKGMPVAVEEVKNLQKEKDWFQDLEIVIKNISDKPIYFMAFSIVFPDVLTPGDEHAPIAAGFPIRFGDRRLRDFRNLAGPEDDSIKPGETYVFTIPKWAAEGFDNMLKRYNPLPEATNNFTLRFDAFSFGDGTGYEGGGLNGLRDYRRKTSLDKNRYDRGSTRRAQKSQERLLHAVGRKNTPAQDREYKVKTFKGMPVAVEEVKNLQKEKDWFQDLEIVVKNISDKPIYFIAFSVVFPDIAPPADAPKGATVGFPLRYGRAALGDLRNLASPEDVPIKPGETHVFTITKGFAVGLENMGKQMNLPPEATKKIVLRFDTFSFGDGTGYEGGGFNGLRDYRSSTRRAQKSEEWLLHAVGRKSMPAQDRKYKVMTFKGMPVAVEEIRNLQKEKDWFRDLEIVVKNISNKPIYYMSFTIVFPDVPPPADAPAGTTVGVILRFGNRDLQDLRNLAGPEDDSIKPGETHVFTIDKGHAEGFENRQMRQNLPPEATKNFYLRFDTFSFGDGTGFVGGGLNGLKDYRRSTSLDKNRDDPIGLRRVR